MIDVNPLNGKRELGITEIKVYIYKANLMFPWVRDQITEAWQNRKSSRSAERRSLTLSSISSGTPNSNNTMLMPLNPTPESFSVNVISLEGNTMCVNVKPDLTVDGVKTMAIKHFYGSDTAKITSRFRLIHASKYKHLPDDHNMNEEGVSESDELMLVEIRQPPPKENISEEALKGPNEEAIARATSNLPVLDPPPPIPTADCTTDFQNEIRKILISLVQSSARILFHSPNAEKFYEVVKDKLEARCKPTSDPKVVKTLIEMGYSHSKVQKAVRLRKSNITEALEWLIEHQNDDSDTSDDDVEMSTPNAGVEAGPSSTVDSKKKTLKEACTDLFGGDRENPKKEENLITIVDLLLQSFHQYKKLEFKPNPKMVENLLEMGFEEKNIVTALKTTGNDHSNACEWLLGERRRSLQDLDEGLDPDGPIYKAIMSNPHIQLSLTNPKMLLAYLSMLETPASANIWINDPEVSPVLSQIYTTYHSEKHAIHMSRYYAK